MFEISSVEKPGISLVNFSLSAYNILFKATLQDANFAHPLD